jgi:hypothetical protein
MLALETLLTSRPQRLHNSFLTPFERFESERHRPQYTSILVYSDARSILECIWPSIVSGKSLLIIYTSC